MVPSPITVLVCDDNAALRRLLGQVIDGERGLDLVGEAESTEELLTLLDDELPDVILLDVSLPGLSGLEGIGKIRAAGFTSPIVVMSADRRNEVPARQAGADSFFYKGESDVMALIDVVRRAAARTPPSR